MCSNVQQANIMARHALFIASWIQVIPSQPAICTVMPGHVGVMRLLMWPMAPEIRMQHVKHSKTCISAGKQRKGYV